MKTWTLKQQLHHEDVQEAIVLIHRARKDLNAARDLLSGHSGTAVTDAYVHANEALYHASRAKDTLVPHYHGMAQARKEALGN